MRYSKILPVPLGVDRTEWEALIKSFREDPLAAHRTFEQPGYYALLSELAKDVQTAVDRLSYKLPEEVHLATLPTGQVNGRAWRIPSGGLWVALDDGLFTYLYLLAKTVATFLPVQDLPESDQWELSIGPEHLYDKFKANEDGHRRYLEALTAMFVLGHPDRAPLRPLFGPGQKLANCLVLTAETFIVAHEYGHLILRHYDPQRPEVRRPLYAGIDVNEFVTSIQDELDADQLALQLTRECHRELGWAPVQTRIGLYFLFACLDLIEQICGTDSTHPTLEVRMGKVLMYLFQFPLNPLTY